MFSSIYRIFRHVPFLRTICQICRKQFNVFNQHAHSVTVGVEKTFGTCGRRAPIWIGWSKTPPNSSFRFFTGCLHETMSDRIRFFMAYPARTVFPMCYSSYSELPVRINGTLEEYFCQLFIPLLVLPHLSRTATFPWLRAPASQQRPSRKFNSF